MSETFKWEGQEDTEMGIATFYLPSGPVSATFKTFAVAHGLHNAIQCSLKEVRFEARLELLNEIARLKP